MKSMLLTSFLVASTLLFSPCQPLKCMSGTHNHVTSSLVSVSCNTKCLKTEYTTHTKIPGLNIIELKQSTLSCAPTLAYCTTAIADQCRLLKDGLAMQMSLQINISDCTTTCCSTSNCNTPGSSTGNPAAVMPSSPVIPTGNPFTLQPSGGESANSSLTCKQGVKNYVVDNVKSDPCSTACVTNNVEVFFESFGASFSFHHSTFMCAPIENFCAKFDACSILKNQLKKMNFGVPAGNITTRSCKTTCCTTSNCNQINPAINYQLISGSPTNETTLRVPVASSTDNVVTTTIGLVTTALTSKVASKSPESQSTEAQTSKVSKSPNKTPALPSGGTPASGQFPCKKGVKNFVIDTVADGQCMTTCVKNDVTVHLDVEGKSRKFYQTTMLCAPVKDYCTKEKLCNSIESELKKNDFGSGVSNLRVTDCTTKCCKTSNCNQLNSTINYNLLDNGAIKYVPNFMILVLVSSVSIFFSFKF